MESRDEDEGKEEEEHLLKVLEGGVESFKADLSIEYTDQVLAVNVRVIIS